MGHKIHIRICNRLCCRFGIRVLIAAGVVMPSLASAQDQEDSDIGAPASSEAYVDRLIDDGNLEPSLTSEVVRVTNTKGNLRSLVAELNGARISSTSNADSIDTSPFDNVQQEAGVLVSARYQTDNFGLLGLDAQLGRGSRPDPFAVANGDRWTGLFELTSSGLPLGSGWLIDSALGTTSTPLIGLFDRQARFFLPVTPILGGAVTFDAYRPVAPGESFSDPKPFASFNISVGEPGLLGGLLLTDYTGLSGLLVSAGGQSELSPGLTAGVQAIAVDDTRDPFAVILASSDPGGDTRLVSSRAIVGSMGLSRQKFRLQANAVWSTRSSNGVAPSEFLADGDAHGASLDAVYRSGRSLHNGGVYYFGPGLTWGTSAILSNAFGAYYRFSTSSQRWRWTFNIDAIDSVDRTGSSGIVVNADFRRNLNFDSAVGVNASLRVANGQSAGQVLGYVDFETGFGSSRAEAGWSSDRLSNLYRIGFIQNWSLPQSLPAGSRLSTQVSYQHRSQSDQASQVLNRDLTESADSFGIAMSAGLMPLKDTTIDATFAYSSDASATAAEFFGPFQSTGVSFGTLTSQQTESFSATLVASARLSPSLSLSGTYTDATSSLISRFGIPLFGSPLGLSDDQLDDLRRSSFRLRAAYLTLRYSISAGRPSGFLGAREYPVGGLGKLEGRVFLDENRNGKWDPAESGARGIVVILDGIQAVRTDDVGRYRFEGVADGTHRVTVNADNLPLPWFIEANDKEGIGEPFSAEVEIGVRGTTVLDIAALQRP